MMGIFSRILGTVLSFHFLILPILAETAKDVKSEMKQDSELKNKQEKAQKWLLPPDVTMQDAQEMVGLVQGFYSMGGHWGSGWQEEEGRKAPTFRVYVTADFSPNQRALFQKVVDALKKPTYKPGKAEQDALDALNKKVNLHVKDAELPEILNALQNQVGLPIQMSPSLKDAIKEGKEAISDYSVTLNLENISLKTCFAFLMEVLEDLTLTSSQCLEIADGKLIFCLPSEFREQMETDDITADLTVRAYPIPKEIQEAQKIQVHLPFQFRGMNNSSEILEVFIEAIRNIFPSKRNITLGCTQERILFVGTKLEHAEIAKFYAMWEGNDTVSETEKEFVKKLRKPVSLNYENMTVKEILTDMQKTFGFPLLIAGFSYLEYESDE
ncbi:MAG: hypothetical protein Q4C70_12920, partial [Planctomycetia bacterium]|nr:hypothetical protein [Planctomycetia bacterium]